METNLWFSTLFCLLKRVAYGKVCLVMKNNTTRKTNLSTATATAPAWVRRELRRLAEAANLGGSSAALEFERQAAALKARYIWARAHGGI